MNLFKWNSREVIRSQGKQIARRLGRELSVEGFYLGSKLAFDLSVRKLDKLRRAQLKMCEDLFGEDFLLSEFEKEFLRGNNDEGNEALCSECS